MNKKESKGFVELEWVCPNCGGRNKGSIKTCAKCGAPQPANVKFERAADEKIITDEKVASAAKAGADIHCGFCGTRNPATATHCSQCGGDLKEGLKREAGQVMQAAPAAPKVVKCKSCGAENPGTARECKECGSPLPRVVAAEAKPEPAKPMPAQAKKPNWLLFGGIGAFLLICCAAILFMFVLPSKSVQGTVADVQWQTSVPVQEVRAVNYSNERGSPPSDAYNLSCHTETEEVCEEKTVDQGNGFAEVVKECHTESAQYCDYTLDEWTTIQTYTLNGSDLNPVYDNPGIASGQRIGTASEVFTVYFNTNNGTLTYSPGSLLDFQQFQIGSVWTIKLNAVGGILSVGR